MQSILVDTVRFSYDDVKKALPENCDEGSDKWINVGVDRWGSKEYLDKFFLRPADPEKFKP